MTIVDILIIIFVLLGGVVGFKNGAMKTLVSFVGICLTVIVAFIFKDKLMVLLYQHLPFFNFFGILKGVTAINILFYQIVSFLIIFMALYFILRVILVSTGLIEWILKKTIFLNLPSKIIGMFIGVVQYYIYVFLVLFILNFPILDIKEMQESEVNKYILNNTPIISEYVINTTETYKEVYNIIKMKKDKTNKEINTEVLVTLLDNNLISVESAKKLVFQNKVEITDESILDNYKESDLYNYLNENIYKKIGG